MAISLCRMLLPAYSESVDSGLGAHYEHPGANTTMSAWASATAHE